MSNVVIIPRKMQPNRARNHICTTQPYDHPLYFWLHTRRFLLFVSPHFWQLKTSSITSFPNFENLILYVGKIQSKCSSNEHIPWVSLPVSFRGCMLQTNVRNISSLFWVYHRILREHILLFRVNPNSRNVYLSLVVILVFHNCP